jgi:hypothetical protein
LTPSFFAASASSFFATSAAAAAATTFAASADACALSARDFAKKGFV